MFRVHVFKMWRPWEREQPYPQHDDNEEGSHRHSDSEEIVVDVVSNSDSCLLYTSRCV